MAAAQSVLTSPPKAHHPSHFPGLAHLSANGPKLAGKYSSCYFSIYSAARWTPSTGMPQDNQFSVLVQGHSGMERWGKIIYLPAAASAVHQHTSNCTLCPATTRTPQPHSGAASSCSAPHSPSGKDVSSPQRSRWGWKKGREGGRQELHLPGCVFIAPADVLVK